jgi:hypothetical protein
MNGGDDDELFPGWGGKDAHPDSPAGGGGPGRFKDALGSGRILIAQSGEHVHPESPAGKRKPVAKFVKLKKPDLNTDRSAMIFMLIVESRPDKPAEAVKKGMRAMYWTIVNRLKYNHHGIFSAPNAKTLRDIIGADGSQFEGFSLNKEKKLAASKEVINRLNAFYKIANNIKDSRRNLYRTFIKNAQSVVIEKGGQDPFQSKGGSFGWRTENKGSPGDNFEFIENLAGNAFYTVTEDFKKELVEHLKKKQKPVKK